MIKFNLYNVADTDTSAKARVAYSIGNRVDGREAVTLYEKDYSRELHKVFANARNDSDGMTDYFENSRVVIFAGDPLYPAALAAAQRHEQKRAA